MHSYIFRKNHEGNIKAQIKQIISKAIFVGHIHCIENRNSRVLNNQDTVKLLTVLAIACEDRNQKTEIHRFENFKH